MQDSRQPQDAPPTAAARPLVALVFPLLLVAALLVADTLEGPKTAFVGILVAAPLLSAVFGSPRTVLLVGLVALVSGGVFGALTQDGQNAAQVTRLAIIGLFTAVAVLGAAARVRGEARLAQAVRVVAAVTEAIIRPLPAQVGGVGLACRYIGADAEAHVGGDFYEVLDTPHGVRVVVGDVRGKGLSAVRMANYVLGAFRASARREPCLQQVVDALDDIVATEGENEDFVTAVLLEVRDGVVRGVSCGHPQPVLVDGPLPREAGLPVDVPLGLGAGEVVPGVVGGAPGGLLLHSDGLTEARPVGGEFLDLSVLLRSLAGARGEDLLTGIVDAVRSHVGGTLRDDVALLWLDVTAPARRLRTGSTAVDLSAAEPRQTGSPRTAPAPRQPAAR